MGTLTRERVRERIRGGWGRVWGVRGHGFASGGCCVDHDMADRPVSVRAAALLGGRRARAAILVSGPVAGE
jgi:hypothetical protein